MFPQTHWTMVARATLAGDDAGREALAGMMTDYRGPVLVQLRARGFGPQEAEDAAHEFFLRWMESRAWKRADRLRGKFRSFLLGALNHVLAHLAAKENAVRRGGGVAVLSLDQVDWDAEPAPPAPEDSEAFDREWAVTLVSRAVTAARAEFAGRGKDQEFAVLRRFLPGSEQPPSLEHAAHLLGTNVNAAKSALHRLRERFRELLRTEVARTVSAPHEVDEEMRYLRSLLMNLPPRRILEAENGNVS